MCSYGYICVNVSVVCLCMCTSYNFYVDLFNPVTDLSQESAKIVVMRAFGAHTCKEIARLQSESAAKFF